MRSDSMLCAGVARLKITPPIGIRMWGYTAQESVSDSIEGEITATAIALAVDGNTVILIGCDLLAIQSPYVDQIRRRIGERLSISRESVLINTSHTHLSALLPGWQVDTPEQQRIQERYFLTLQDALVSVAALAECRLQPVWIGSARGTAEIGINRRERLEEGRIVIGNNPDGPVDQGVDVIRLDTLTGKPMAVIFSAAVHPICLGFTTSQLSPDFVGTARDVIERSTGVPSVFLQGAAGNISPIFGVGAGGADQYENKERIGLMLAGEVLKTWAAIRTHNRRGPRRIVHSVAVTSTWDYEPLSVPHTTCLGVATRRLVLPMAALPNRVTAQQTLQESRSRLKEVQRGQQLGAIHVAKRVADWAEKVWEAVERNEPVTRELVVWSLRVDRVGIVAVNGEPFAELALEVKHRSPLPHTLFLGYSNGCLGYLPTPEAFDEGGMEVEESVCNYLLPTGFTPEWGPAIVNTSLELLNGLADEDSPEAASPNGSTVPVHPQS